MPYCDRFSKQKYLKQQLSKDVFSGTQHVEFPQAQLREKCVRACACVCLCVLSYYLYCAKLFFVLGDSGCEFDARQLWLKTFSWSTEDH